MGIASRVCSKKCWKFAFLPGCLRFQCGHRRDSYPIPWINDSINSLESTSVFSTPGANSGSWQTKHDKKGTVQTDFVKHNGLNWYTGLLLGLKHSPKYFRVRWAWYWHFSNGSMSWFTLTMSLLFMIPEEHLRHVASIVQLRGKIGMALKLKKYFFSTQLTNLVIWLWPSAYILVWRHFMRYATEDTWR